MYIKQNDSVYRYKQILFDVFRDLLQYAKTRKHITDNKFGACQKNLVLELVEVYDI